MKTLTFNIAILLSLVLNFLFNNNPLMAKSSSVKKKGKIEVYYEEYADGSHKLKHNLITDNGERISLKVEKKDHKFQTGQEVEIEGQLTDENILILGAESGPSYGTSPGLLGNTFGEQKVLVVMLNFQDKITSAWPKDSVIFTLNEANQFFKEASYGQTWLTTDVTDWLTIPINSTCDMGIISDLADQAASNAGFDVASYDRLLYTWDRVDGCGWGGLGTVGGTPSRAWFNGGDILRRISVTHELGHNLGLYHSHDLLCNGVTLAENCSIREYGDGADNMGTGHGHFNVYQKDRLGWLHGRIQTVTSSGQYHIDHHEFDSQRLLALKVLKGFNSTYNSDDWYYLEFRQAVGFDNVLSYGTNNFTSAITIHTGNESFGNTSYLLDMNPATSHFADAGLNVGQSYSDSNAKVSFRTVSANSNGAEVYIDLGGSDSIICQQANPTLSVTPIKAPAVIAGTSVTYSITLSNNDSSECSQRSFNLSTVHPNGWSVNFLNSSLSILPGTSSSTSMTVTSALSGSNGIYNINLIAANGIYSESSTITYEIDNPIVQPPPIEPDTIAPIVSITSPTDGEAFLAGEKIKITIDAQDNVAIDRVEVLINDALKCTLTTSPYMCEYTVPKRVKFQSLSILGRAYDTSNNMSSDSLSLLKDSSLDSGVGKANGKGGKR